ncbi:phytol kinase 1 [Scenedesmus sp. PABB004]|nr:phytol kinase 1 [Scenedesmus sp. PABB004]
MPAAARLPGAAAGAARHASAAPRPVAVRALCGAGAGQLRLPRPDQALGVPAAAQRRRAAPAPPATQQSPGGRRVAARAAPPEALAALAGLQALPNWDWICAALAAVCAFVWVKMFDGLAAAGRLDKKLSRKLVHITAGPLFMLTWIFFSEQPQARFIAALVPSINLVRLLAVGSGALPDPGLVASVSRSGDRGELLKGPLYYVIILISVTLLFWRVNPAGLITVAMMAGGDGVADVAGRRWGGAPGCGGALPWNGSKSWAGSAGMFVAGLAMAGGFFALFCAAGYFECWPLAAVAPYLVAVCGACTLVESAPINGWFDDNLSVPLVAVGLSLALLPLAASAAAGCALHAPALQMLHLG